MSNFIIRKIDFKREFKKKKNNIILSLLHWMNKMYIKIIAHEIEIEFIKKNIKHFQ